MLTRVFLLCCCVVVLGTACAEPPSYGGVGVFRHFGAVDIAESRFMLSIKNIFISDRAARNQKTFSLTNTIHLFLGGGTRLSVRPLEKYSN